MTDHRPGEWPAGLSPVPLTVVPDGGGQPPHDPSPVKVPVPEVRLVVTVDLTGSYDSSNEVHEDLRQQTRRNTDCHTAIVRLGEDALRHSLLLARAIAGVFYLSAQAIEVHVPAGHLLAEHLGREVAREARSMVSEHETFLLNIRTPG
jgi:hypothetical protein